MIMAAPDRRKLFNAPADGNTLRILLATDIHLGYAEKDGIRGEDSFRTFEEIMNIGLMNEVDFVLLGGDLFHENKPSRQAIFKCMETLKKSCLGSKPVQFEIVSDPAVNFPNSGIVNYEDENVNIGLPVFSIHGNHDDPSGFGGKCPLDILSSCKLVNYFGTASNPNDIEIMPVLFQKGDTKLALYGLGALRDERLHRTFQQNNVKWGRPSEDAEDWFNIFVIHQNRVQHSSTQKNVISETMLPKFLDLVFWAHEHECIMDLSRSEAGGFFVVQPGSSVVTSLMPGEAKPKRVGILEIQRDKCRLVPVPLFTVRPFLIEEVELAKVEELQGRLTDMNAVQEYLIEKELGERIQVNDMLARVPEMFPKPCEVDFESYHDENARLPLIRLRVDYTGSVVINVQRFGSEFINRVANPNELLLFHKRRVVQRKERDDGAADVNECEIEHDLQIDQDVNTIQIQEIVSKHLGPLQLLPDVMLADAIQQFVEKSDTDAIDEFVDKTLADVQKELMKMNESALHKREDLERFVKTQADKMKAKYSQMDQSRRKAEEEERLLKRAAEAGPAAVDDGLEEIDGDEDESAKSFSASSSSLSAAAAAAKRGGASSSRGRKTAAAASSSSLSLASVPADSGSSRGRGRGRGRGAASSSSSRAKAASSKRGKKAKDSDDDSDEVEAEEPDFDDQGEEPEFLPPAPKSRVKAASKTEPKKRKTAVSSDEDDNEQLPPSSSSKPPSSTLSSASTKSIKSLFKAEPVDLTQDEDILATSKSSSSTLSSAKPVGQRTLPTLSSSNAAKKRKTGQLPLVSSQIDESENSSAAWGSRKK